MKTLIAVLMTASALTIGASIPQASAHGKWHQPMSLSCYFDAQHVKHCP